MGASGSGKSTLMAILGCLDPPSGGHYFLEASTSRRLGARAGEASRRAAGFVFQSLQPFSPARSAIENVALPLFYSERETDGVHRLEKARSGVEAACGLADRRKQYARATLRPPARQRSPSARALINGPSVLFADEPTGISNTKTSHEIMETLVTLNRDQGVTTLSSPTNPTSPNTPASSSPCAMAYSLGRAPEGQRPEPGRPRRAAKCGRAVGRRLDLFQPASDRLDGRCARVSRLASHI